MDCRATDRLLGGVTRQIMHPSRHHAVFRANAALEAGRAVARMLLDTPDPVLLYDQLLYKPPGHPAETPWHQDLAYREVPFLAAGTPIRGSAVMFWVALDDVDAATGCMHFVPGAHTGALLPHVVASGDPVDDARLLAIAEPERHLALETAIACPLAAGGATVHGVGTPHYTSANRSRTRRRRAYIFNLMRPPDDPRMTRDRSRTSPGNG